jgi:hypothetical protein
MCPPPRNTNAKDEPIMIHDGGHARIARKGRPVDSSAVTAWRRTKMIMAERPIPCLSAATQHEHGGGGGGGGGCIYLDGRRVAEILTEILKRELRMK